MAQQSDFVCRTCADSIDNPIFVQIFTTLPAKKYFSPFGQYHEPHQSTAYLA
jgi:hypothetical protein